MAYSGNIGQFERHVIECLAEPFNLLACHPVYPTENDDVGDQLSILSAPVCRAVSRRVFGVSTERSVSQRSQTATPNCNESYLIMKVSSTVCPGRSPEVSSASGDTLP